MNSFFISLLLRVIITTVGSLLGNFFDIATYIYMPYIIWGVGVCILNMILEKKHINKFMNEID